MGGDNRSSVVAAHRVHTDGGYMHTVGVRELRLRLAEVLRSEERWLVRSRGRGEVGAVVPALEARLLERLERAGELERLKERYPEEV